MPQQTGMVKPHTQHRGEQQLTWKKHLPAPGKPPQTSAGKHRGCESSRRFGCSPVPSFSSAHHLTVLLPPSQLPVGSPTAPPGPAWCKRSAGSREPGTDTPQGQTLLLWCLSRRRSGDLCLEQHSWLRDPWVSSAVCPCSHLGLGLPADPACHPDLKSVLGRCLHSHIPALQAAGTSAMCHFSDPEGLGGAWRMGM